MQYTVVKKARNLCFVNIKHRGAFEIPFFLSADRHWDNPMSQQEMQQQHLEEVVERDAGVFDFGDLFCAMQGKDDRRSSKRDLRPEHLSDDYFDRLIDTAADFFSPFAKRIIMLGMGNHETKVLEKHETNLTDRLVKELNSRNKSRIYNGGYSGWVLFRFQNQRTGQVVVKRMWYIHGYGGGGPVTKGVIQSNRKAVYLPDADFVVSGHVHESWTFPIVRVRCDEDGNRSFDEQTHFQVPTYKEEYNDGYLGWHVEGGRPPKPVGGLWLIFKSTRNGVDFHTERAR